MRRLLLFVFLATLASASVAGADEIKIQPLKDGVDYAGFGTMIEPPQPRDGRCSGSFHSPEWATDEVRAYTFDLVVGREIGIPLNDFAVQVIGCTADGVKSDLRSLVGRGI